MIIKTDELIKCNEPDCETKQCAMQRCKGCNNHFCDTYLNEHSCKTPENETNTAEHSGDEYMFSIDSEVFKINEHLNPVKLSPSYFGKRPHEMYETLQQIAAEGRAYGGQDFQFQRLSTINEILPPVKFHQEGIKIYYPLRNSEIYEIENTKKLFEFLFREYVDFIYNWLAVYVCRNHLRLPTIILTGKRGIGKTKIMNFVCSMFPEKLSIIQRDIPKQFQDHHLKKFLGLDEFDGNQKQLYDTLKLYQGADTLPVELKFMPRFKIQNNLNIIVASNNPRPVYFEATEMPENEKENSWFILDLSYIEKERFPLTPQQLQRVIDGAPNFAREFLIPRYEQLETDGLLHTARFTTPCPITPEQIRMFEQSTSELNYFAQRVLCEIITRFEEVAVTESMITKVIEGVNRIENPQRFGTIQIKKRLIDSGHISKDRTARTKTTSGKGYKIINKPEMLKETETTEPGALNRDEPAPF